MGGGLKKLNRKVAKTANNKGIKTGDIKKGLNKIIQQGERAGFKEIRKAGLRRDQNIADTVEKKFKEWREENNISFDKKYLEDNVMPGLKRNTNRVVEQWDGF